MWLKKLLLHNGSVKMDEYYGMYIMYNSVVMYEAWSITKECAVTDQLNVA